MKKYSELKEGERINIFGETLVVEKIEKSGAGVKQGREKVRVEAKNDKGEEKVIIRLGNEAVNVS